jgi:hypothetical protein
MADLADMRAALASVAALVNDEAVLANALRLLADSLAAKVTKTSASPDAPAGSDAARRPGRTPKFAKPASHPVNAAAMDALRKVCDVRGGIADVVKATGLSRTCVERVLVSGRGNDRTCKLIRQWAAARRKAEPAPAPATAATPPQVSDRPRLKVVPPPSPVGGGWNELADAVKATAISCRIGINADAIASASGASVAAVEALLSGGEIAEADEDHLMQWVAA